MAVWFGQDTCVHILAPLEYSVGRRGLSLLENGEWLSDYTYAIRTNFISKEPNYYYNQSIDVLLMQ